MSGKCGGTPDLKRYDGKCVRITDADGNVFEGICSYNGEEYDEHEFGRCEEALQLPFFLFFKSDIVSLESLEDHTGPWGKFSAPWGTLEEKAAEDGIDGITEILFCEDPAHILRMLRCLDHSLDPASGRDFPCRRDTVGALTELLESTKDDAVREEAERLIDKQRTP